jgi:hypothetical protein
MLAAFSSYVISYLGAVFGNAPPDVFQELLNVIPKVVRKEIMHDNLRDVQGTLMDIMDGSNFWSQALANDTEMRKVYMQNLQTDLNNIKRQIFNSCYDSPSSGSCKNWRNSGSIIHETVFVATHLSSMIANANLYAGNVNTVRSFTSRVRDLGGKYLNLLEESYWAYSNHRLANIQWWSKKKYNVGYVCGRAGHYCYKIQGGMDTFLNYDILVNDCRQGRGEIHVSGPYRPPYPSQAHADNLNRCIQTYRNDVNSQLERLRGQISDIRKMVQGAASLGTRNLDIVV